MSVATTTITITMQTAMLLHVTTTPPHTTTTIGSRPATALALQIATNLSPQEIQSPVHPAPNQFFLDNHHNVETIRCPRLVFRL